MILKPGDVIDVAIRCARVVELDDGWLTFKYGDPAEEHYVDRVQLAAESVSWDRVAGPDWPPKPGEVWRQESDHTARDYFVRSHNCQHEPPNTCYAEIELVDQDGAERPYPIETTLPAGLRPLVRVYPAPSGGAR